MSRSAHSDRYERLKELLIAQRKNAGMTQATVAERLGKPQSFVAKYENGERRLDVVEFIEVAEAIGFKPSALFDVLS